MRSFLQRLGKLNDIGTIIAAIVLFLGFTFVTDSFFTAYNLFNVGRNFLRTFDLDLAAAGIVKRDAQGRTVDVHSMRHTFATLLAKRGVSPGVAQKLMRHSDIRLTMNTYTHLDLADTAGAVAALPTF